MVNVSLTNPREVGRRSIGYTLVPEAADPLAPQ
jgi:hypothetical protein